MESVAYVNNPNDDDYQPDTTSISAVAKMGNQPQNQLIALRRLLGVNRLLNHTVPGSRTTAKDKFQFIFICASCFGHGFNSLFPDMSILDLKIE